MSPSPKYGNRYLEPVVSVCVLLCLPSCNPDTCRAGGSFLPAGKVKFSPVGNQPEPCVLPLLPWHQQPAKINAMPWRSTENRSLPALWKHEAVWRYEAQKTLTSTIASSSTEPNIDYSSPLVFVMVEFPLNAHLDNLDAACLFGLCILSATMWKGNQKANQNHLYETDSIKKLLAISMVFL